MAFLMRPKVMLAVRVFYLVLIVTVVAMSVARYFTTAPQRRTRSSIIALSMVRASSRDLHSQCKLTIAIAGR
jgi:hypothetical protein